MAIKGLSHKCHSVRTSCVVMLKKLTPGLIERDVELLNRRGELDGAGAKKDGSPSTSKANGDGWHLLSKFNKTLQMHAECSREYTEKFK